MNTLLSLTIVAFNVYLFYKLHFRREAVKCIDECTEAFQRTVRAAHFMRVSWLDFRGFSLCSETLQTPLVGIILLAEIASIPLQEVIREYEKDRYSKQACNCH